MLDHTVSLVQVKMNSVVEVSFCSFASSKLAVTANLSVLTDIITKEVKFKVEIKGVAISTREFEKIDDAISYYNNLGK